jgi:glycosyltransferase involved in cell wall biosynthesis
MMRIAVSRDIAPEVTIGMPVYNGEQHIVQAVESMLQQTFANFELIVSDNASTDRTQAICQELSARDRRIRYIRQCRNMGAVPNWDFVARSAKGMYFKWASANDYCDPTMLERCLNILKSSPDIALCYGRTCLVDNRGNSLGVYPYDLSAEQERASARFISVRNRLNLNNAQCGVMRLDKLRQTRLGRSYPGGDSILTAELALYGKFRLLEDVLLFRRMDEGSASRYLSEEQLRVFLDPGSAHKGHTAWRRHWDCCWSVLRARINWREKHAALDFVLRSAYWDRKELWRELGGSAADEDSTQ